jgi:hypothetical protein
MPTTNIPATGAVGVEPPPDAPIEVSQPLQPDAGRIVLADPRTGLPTGEVVDPAARARANERELAPLRYERPAAPAAQSGVTGKAIDGLDPFYAQEVARRAALPDAKEFPAASNSDSPARGLPGTAAVPLRQTKSLALTGGFGDTGEAMYYPLDGQELLALSEALCDRLVDRIRNDLRFSMALTYPRAAVRLQLIVEGEVDDQGFTIEYVDKKDQTPLEVAQQHGQSVVFVLTEERREFTSTGEVESPPDAIRDELGLVKPRKQYVQTGMGRQLADQPLGF